MEQKKNNQKNKAFDPYAPHKIKWWGWPLLLLLIVGTVYIIMTRDNKGKTQPFSRESLGRLRRHNEVKAACSAHSITSPTSRQHLCKKALTMR